MKIVIGFKRRGDRKTKEAVFTGGISFVNGQALAFISNNQPIAIDFIRQEQEENESAKSFRTSSAV